MRGSAGRIMIRPGQAIMIAWLTTAHAPLWEPAHERAPPKKKPPITRRSIAYSLARDLTAIEPPTRRKGARDWISLRPGVLARWAVLLAFAREACGRRGRYPVDASRLTL